MFFKLNFILNRIFYDTISQLIKIRRQKVISRVGKESCLKYDHKVVNDVRPTIIRRIMKLKDEGSCIYLKEKIKLSC